LIWWFSFLCPCVLKVLTLGLYQLTVLATESPLFSYALSNLKPFSGFHITWNWFHGLQGLSWTSPGYTTTYAPFPIILPWTSWLQLTNLIASLHLTALPMFTIPPTFPCQQNTLNPHFHHCDFHVIFFPKATEYIFNV
jgi:hypothetical protein